MKIFLLAALDELNHPLRHTGWRGRYQCLHHDLCVWTSYQQWKASGRA